MRGINIGDILLPASLAGGFGIIILGTIIEADFIRELGAFLLLFCIFIFPTLFQRDKESHGN